MSKFAHHRPPLLPFTMITLTGCEPLLTPLVPGPDDALIFNVPERERCNSELVVQSRKVPPYVVTIPNAASGPLAHRRIGLITFHGKVSMLEGVIQVAAEVAHWSAEPPFGFNNHNICGPIVSGLWSMRILMPWGITASEELKFYDRNGPQNLDKVIVIAYCCIVLVVMSWTYISSSRSLKPLSCTITPSHGTEQLVYRPECFELFHCTLGALWRVQLSHTALYTL
ncbi:hypothetical protein PSTT_16145 [Puccinia striiformis]|uniref:Uncharacterized protein n=1 Tax=Puccinia striiformis TaxID=27350 RepID=A0A2S4UE65_9BASI|nr:hypothetical protein PSTT_16145 [Puccinia striiformis]